MSTRRRRLPRPEAGPPESPAAVPGPTLPTLAGLPAPSGPIAAAPLLVAYSGGLDSTVLLHALKDHPARSALRAVHVHHGLQAAADSWVEHCRRHCAALGITLEVLYVRVDPDARAGPEAAARDARYAALRQALLPGECLVTAHHQDDQAETLLLRLLRGSGAEGLAGMRALSLWEGAWLWRPLLDLPRTALRDYAVAGGLDWIEDPQNRDPRYARSWLRERVVPLLRARYPQADRSLARAARLLAESAGLAADLGALDLGTASVGRGLSVAAAAALTSARRNNLLRCWLVRGGFAAPDARLLERIWTDVGLSREDATPCLQWPGCEIRRHGGVLFAMAPLAPPPGAWCCDWGAEATLELPPDCGRLLANRVPGAGLSVRFTQGGEQLRLASGGPSRRLKHLFQEQGVPPWVRLRTPLVCLDGALALVAGVGESAAWRDFCAAGGFALRWHDPFTTDAL